jgi:putative inorganic carbon (HCO3(-)) transporter
MEEQITDIQIDANFCRSINAGGEPSLAARPAPRQRRLTGAYAALLAFMLVYFLRPEDWIPQLSTFPFAKITGLLAVVALAFSLPEIRQRLPREIFYFALLIGQLFLAAVLSPVWRGGGIAIATSLLKAFIVIVVMILAVNSAQRLKWLLFTQAASAAVMTAANLWQSRSVLGRLEGIQGGNYGDPNDLALSLVISLPLAMALFFSARRPIEKMLWMAAALEMTLAILLTGSRGGFLAFLVTAGACVWGFGIRGGRGYLVGVAAIVGGVMLLTVGGTVFGRLAGTFDSTNDTAAAYASSEERQQLFWRSVEVTKEHPLFGVGPGNFAQVSGIWHVAHNAFTQVSAEGGIPALFLYVLILWRGFANVRAAKRLARKRRETALFGKALFASLAGYVVGSTFLSVPYAFFPYFLVGYTMALDSIANGLNAQSRTAEETASAAPERLQELWLAGSLPK